MHVLARVLLPLTALGLLLVGCGGDDGGESATEAAPEPSAAAESDEGETSGGSGGESGEGSASGEFGDVVGGSLELSGAVDETYGADQLVAAGGCQGDSFTLQLQAEDPSTGQTLVNLQTGFGEDLAGGETGTFELERVRVDVYEAGDLSSAQDFDGSGTLDITAHDAGDDFAEREMELTLSAPDLEGDEAPLTVDADLTWLMGCP